MYPPKTAAQFMALALAEVGYVEGPAENETKYQKTNQAWCGAFINWVAKAADVSIPNCVSTLSGAQAFEARAQYHPSAKAMPRRGDIAFFDFPNDSINKISHIGLVIGHNHENKTVTTIEGNTSGTGSQRNGGMVMIKKRSYAVGDEIVGFGRPDYAPYNGPWPEIPKKEETPKAETPKSAKKGKK
jgi:hypothetical protein